MSHAINNFKGPYLFLSNFSPDPVLYEGAWYSTSEHAYQAQKTMNAQAREGIRSAPTAYACKKAARAVLLRADWEQVKDEVMLEVLRAKFKNTRLAQRLLLTGSAELIEMNTWGDTYWGVCGGQGLNKLGTLLMQVRQELQRDTLPDRIGAVL
jgi:ribA/ribD-fused uncharacterized protein